jgi:sugar phosphate isomerase/epimerase
VRSKSSKSAAKQIKVAIVQGRLSSPVGARYQHFPIHAWRNEFATAAEMGFDGIEWIVSDFSNPLFDPESVREIGRLTQDTNIEVTSIGLDVFMYQPIIRLDWADVTWVFDRLAKVAEQLGVGRVNIPIEENSGIRNEMDRERVVTALGRIMKRYGQALPKVSLETDLSARNASALLSRLEFGNLGLILDFGNIAANGFATSDFMNSCADRIYAFHVKDRRKAFGASCPLGSGDAELKYALSRTGMIPHLADITIQSYRSQRGYLNDARSAIAYVRRLLKASH